MTPKIDLTPQDIEYLAGVTHPNKGENDYCIGMTEGDARTLIYSAETTKDGYCLMPDNTKAKKLGFAGQDDIRAFIMRKYRNLAKGYVKNFFSPDDGKEDSGNRDGVKADENTKVSSHGDKSVNFPHPMDGGKTRFPRNPSFYADSLNYLRTGKVPHENNAIKRQGYIVYPDGKIHFSAMPDREKEGILKMTMVSGERTEQYDAFSEITKREALTNMDRDLQMIWNNAGLTPWEKKNALFEWWDDCIEPGDSAGERDVAGAMYIRERTMEFIREKLPEGSNLAYTAEELRKLNTRADRLSKMEFNPYTQNGRKSGDWLEAFLD